ncbi:MAG: DUF503 domain-containing protein [Chloroflexota bacterium]
MSIGVLILNLMIPGCSSLKEKRGRLRPLITKLRKDFNLSVAEIDDLDIWQSSVVACAMVSNDARQTRKVLQKVADWVEVTWRDVDVVDDQIELF